MSSAELNYDIFDKELLAIMYALDKWRCYLLDAAEPFEIWTDHKNLTYFKKEIKLNARRMRWYLTIQDYNFVIRYIPGEQNSKADILSRLPWYKEEIPEKKEFALLDAKRFINKTHFVKQVRFGKKVCTLQPVALFVEEQFWKEGTSTLSKHPIPSRQYNIEQSRLLRKQNNCKKNNLRMFSRIEIRNKQQTLKRNALKREARRFKELRQTTLKSNLQDIIREETLFV